MKIHSWKQLTRLNEYLKNIATFVFFDLKLLFCACSELLQEQSLISSLLLIWEAIYFCWNFSTGCLTPWQNTWTRQFELLKNFAWNDRLECSCFQMFLKWIYKFYLQRFCGYVNNSSIFSFHGSFIHITKFT